MKPESLLALWTIRARYVEPQVSPAFLEISAWEAQVI